MNTTKNKNGKLVNYAPPDNGDGNEGNSNGIRSLKRDMGGKIFNTNVPGKQFIKLKNELVDFINNWPYKEVATQSEKQKGGVEFSNALGKVEPEE